MQAEKTDAPAPDRSYLYNEDGTLRSAAELAAISPKPKAAAKSAKPKAKAKAKAQTKAARTPRTKPEAKARVLRPLCGQRKKDGSACTAHVMLLADGIPAWYCTDHRPPHLHLTEAELTWLHRTLDTDDRPLVERVVRLMGWGQVREQARKGGAL